MGLFVMSQVNWCQTKQAGCFLLAFGAVAFAAITFVLGMVVNDALFQREAVRQGVARWEMKSQADPEVVFRWNTGGKE